MVHERISALNLATGFSTGTPGRVTESSRHSGFRTAVYNPRSPRPGQPGKPLQLYTGLVPKPSLALTPPSKAGTMTQPSPALALVSVGTLTQRQLKTSERADSWEDS